MNDHERAPCDEGGEAPCFAHLLDDETYDELDDPSRDETDRTTREDSSS